MNFKTFRKSIKHYSHPKMRMEKKKFGKNIIIDDSYNANYDSMKSGIEYIIKTYEKKYHILLYLGDMLELGEWSEHYHRRIGKLINNSNVDVLYTTGQNTKYILEEIKNDKIIKNEFKSNNDNDIINIRNKVISDLNKYKKSILYVKASRSIGLNKIVDSIINNN